MENALCRMNIGKTAGPSEITADLRKFMEQDSVNKVNGCGKRIAGWHENAGQLESVYWCHFKKGKVTQDHTDIAKVSNC